MNAFAAVPSAVSRASISSMTRRASRIGSSLTTEPVRACHTTSFATSGARTLAVAALPALSACLDMSTTGTATDDPGGGL